MTSQSPSPAIAAKVEQNPHVGVKKGPSGSRAVPAAGAAKGSIFGFLHGFAGINGGIFTPLDYVDLSLPPGHTSQTACLSFQASLRSVLTMRYFFWYLVRFETTLSVVVQLSHGHDDLPVPIVFCATFTTTFTLLTTSGRSRPSQDRPLHSIFRSQVAQPYLVRFRDR